MSSAEREYRRLLRNLRLVYDAEIDGRPKRLMGSSMAKLIREGYCEPAEYYNPTREGQRHVKSIRLTTKGRLYYCENCEDDK